MPHYPDLQGRVAVVTGASRRTGLGAAFCRALAEQGCHIFFTHHQGYDGAHGLGVDPDGPRLLEAEIRAYGVQAESLSVDLADPAAATTVLDRAERRLGPVTILVNNAAHATRDGFERLTAESLDAHYVVNVRATMLLAATFAQRFNGGSGGRIINLTSGQDLGPMPGELAYAATKGAITAFTRSLAREVAPRGITVNAVDPGATDTGWMTPEGHDAVKAANGFGRVGLPADAARTVVFLASDAGGWISGQTLHSRGG